MGEEEGDEGRDRGREGGSSGVFLTLKAQLLQNQSTFRSGDRRPILSPSLCRDRAQREALTSPGSHSRAWLNSPFQECLPKPSSQPLAPRQPNPLRLIPTCSAFSCLEGETPPPSQVSPSGVSFPSKGWAPENTLRPPGQKEQGESEPGEGEVQGERAWGCREGESAL